MTRKKRPAQSIEQAHDYRKFSTLLRQDIYADLHQIRINKGTLDPNKQMRELYLVIEEALEQYVIRQLPDGATARRRASTDKRQVKR